MDKDIKELQEAWCYQKSKPSEIDQLVTQINKVERIFKFQKIFVPVIFALVILTMVTRLSVNIHNVIAISLFFIATLFLIIPLFKNKHSPLLQKFDTSNQTFINDSIKHFKNKMLVPKFYMPIFIVLFIVAINIAFIGAFNDLSFVIKIFIHSATIILFAELFYLRNLGVKSYENKISPLISALETMSH